MAESKSGTSRSSDSKIDEGSVTGPPIVQSTTEATPAEADKTSVPNALDAEHEDQPVRTSRPDRKVAHSLAAGAGEHTPPDPKVYDRDGRLREHPQS